MSYLRVYVDYENLGPALDEIKAQHLGWSGFGIQYGEEERGALSMNPLSAVSREYLIDYAGKVNKSDHFYYYIFSERDEVEEFATILAMKYGGTMKRTDYL